VRQIPSDATASHIALHAYRAAWTFAGTRIPLMAVAGIAIWMPATLN